MSADARAKGSSNVCRITGVAILRGLQGGWNLPLAPLASTYRPMHSHRLVLGLLRYLRILHSAIHLASHRQQVRVHHLATHQQRQQGVRVDAHPALPSACSVVRCVWCRESLSGACEWHLAHAWVRGPVFVTVRPRRPGSVLPDHRLRAARREDYTCTGSHTGALYRVAAALTSLGVAEIAWPHHEEGVRPPDPPNGATRAQAMQF